jgi:hypothetical protein
MAVMVNLGGGFGEENAPRGYGWRYHFLHQHPVQQRHQPPGRRDERHLGPPCSWLYSEKNLARNESGKTRGTIPDEDLRRATIGEQGETVLLE